MTAVRVNPTLKLFYNRLKQSKAHSGISGGTAKVTAAHVQPLQEECVLRCPVRDEKKQQEPKPLLHRIEVMWRSASS